ncbi:hypothetical protein ACF1B0_21080 [Streptomyces anandii]|uniref:hypothetical protein n=1 Tax=Streptomyces anandii TaxID=285454 RepID=UPI0036FBDA91
MTPRRSGDDLGKSFQLTAPGRLTSRSDGSRTERTAADQMRSNWATPASSPLRRDDDPLEETTLGKDENAVRRERR